MCLICYNDNHIYHVTPQRNKESGKSNLINTGLLDFEYASVSIHAGGADAAVAVEDLGLTRVGVCLVTGE